MKRIVTAYREAKHEVRDRLLYEVEEIYRSLPEYLNEEIVIIMETHRNEEDIKPSSEANVLSKPIDIEE